MVEDIPRTVVVLFEGVGSPVLNFGEARVLQHFPWFLSYCGPVELLVVVWSKGGSPAAPVVLQNSW